MTRRTVLIWLTNAMGLLVAAVVGVPSLIKALFPVLRRQPAERWQALGPLEQFPTGQVQAAEIEVARPDDSPSLRARGVYIWRQADEQIIVFSRHCTDLGCPVTHDPGSGWFFCPCHGGIFNEHGQRMAGPPDRPLYRYASRVRNGVIEIDLGSVPPMV